MKGHETQFRCMRPGQPATVTVDPYRDRVFKGHVDSIQCGKERYLRVDGRIREL